MCLLTLVISDMQYVSYSSEGLSDVMCYVRVCVCLYLCAPLRVNRVAHHSRAFLLAVVRQRGEDAVFARLNGELQVRVRIEEHPLLQSNCLKL